ncbi:MAG: SGNH/GDSL hydrolase family protein [Flavobacteriales bacterium]
MDMDQKLSFLALGDSYTIGESVDENERWPNLLVKTCKEKGINFASPHIIAKTGWTTDELNHAIDDANIDDTYDWVSLLIGVNNQYRGRSVDDYKPEFESLLKRAISYANDKKEHVFVLSIPDWGVTPFAHDRDRNAIAREIDAYNLANRQIAEKYQVQYFDITPSTRKAADDLSLLAPDGLHPSGKNYLQWAEMVAEWVVLKTQKSSM